MATRYVGIGGNNASNGQTHATRWLTLAFAFANISGGDSLLITAGTYNFGLTTCQSGSSWVSPTRIAAYPGDVVWWTPDSSYYTVIRFDPDLTGGSEHYIEFDGINMDGANVLSNTITIFIKASGQPHHIRFMNAEIIANENSMEGWAAHPIEIGAKIPSVVGGFEFINLKLHGGGRPGSANPDNGYGIYLSCPNSLIENCQVYDNKGGGIVLYNDDGAAASNNIVRYNRVFDQTRGETPGQQLGIQLHVASNNLVYGNVIYNVQISAGGSDSGQGIAIGSGSDNVLWNNTITDCVKGIEVFSVAVDLVVQNNICYDNSVSDYEDNGSSGTTHNHNVDNGTDPLFVNPGSRDYRITNISPAYHQGVDVGIATDIAGSPYANPPSIGAYEVVEPGGVWQRIGGMKSGSADARQAQTGEMNTTGANVLVVSTGRYTGISATATLTDSYLNTWVPLTDHNNANGIASREYYCIGTPTVGAGHTFLFADAGLIFPALAVEAWYCATLNTIGGQNGSVATSGSTLATGSLNSPTANSMFFAGLAFDDNSAAAVSIDSGFSANVQALVFGYSIGCGIAFKAPASSGAENPTWNVTNAPADGMAASIVFFTSEPVSSGSGLLLGTERNRLVRTS